jgi:hypothetical protein
MWGNTQEGLGIGVLEVSSFQNTHSEIHVFAICFPKEDKSSFSFRRRGK